MQIQNRKTYFIIVPHNITLFYGEFFKQLLIQIFTDYWVSCII